LIIGTCICGSIVTDGNGLAKLLFHVNIASVISIKISVWLNIKLIEVAPFPNPDPSGAARVPAPLLLPPLKSDCIF